MKDNKTYRRPALGFTMIEVLITLLILSGGLLALASFQGVIFGANAISIQRSEATMLAEQKIDEFRAYRDLSTYASIVTGSDSVTSGSAVYTRSWVVTGYASPARKQITLNVSWTDSTNDLQSVKLDTVIASNDPKLTGALIINPVN